MPGRSRVHGRPYLNFAPQLCNTSISGLDEYADGCLLKKGADWYPFCLGGGTGREVWGGGDPQGCPPQKVNVSPIKIKNALLPHATKKTLRMPQKRNSACHKKETPHATKKTPHATKKNSACHKKTLCMPQKKNSTLRMPQKNTKGTRELHTQMRDGSYGFCSYYT